MPVNKTSKAVATKSTRAKTLKSTAAASRKTGRSVTPGGCVLKVLGTIRTPFPEPKGTPLEPSRAKGARATVWIDKPYREALLDLDGFDRVWLLFWLHMAPEGKPLVTPFLDTQQHGQFATRAPARFNPIGISAVRLLAVHEDRIEVADVDIVDGAPLLDIKPYIPEFDSHPKSRPGWFAANRNPRQVADDRFMKKSDAAEPKRLQMSISGMSCEKCVARVRKTLRAMEGVSVESVAIGSAAVTYDRKRLKALQVVAAVRELGFPARPVRRG
ncbi:MAG: tRNA (N6-threonylcarbamoyladenosine(37)-N6)-methyltransferase TrmO [Acidobacteriota bacterium]|nr:tRNA (N6-threonylcarbamoyladenosine(37)-N6)-methyltransferase TrmO [Acidobacteriota bacterium]